MTDEERALEWFRNRRTAITMKGTREMYDIAIRVLQERVIGAVAGKDFESWGGTNEAILPILRESLCKQCSLLHGAENLFI